MGVVYGGQPYTSDHGMGRKLGHSSNVKNQATYTENKVKMNCIKMPVKKL